MKFHSKSIINVFTLFALLASLIGSAVFATPVRAATLIVTNNNDNGAGSLRQTIMDAASGDTINFASSLSGQTILLAATLTIDKNLIIDGSSLASQVTISGNNAVRVMYVNSGATLNLTALTIANGLFSVGGGGGIYNDGGTLTVTNSTFSGNSAVYAGGIYNDGGILTVTNSTFSGNSATGPLGGGGGIFNYGGTLTVTNSTFSGNSAGYGGGIYNYNNSGGTVTNSTFSGNSAGYYGGGMLNQAGAPILNYVTFNGNTASTNGGAMYNLGSSYPVINGGIFWGNNSEIVSTFDSTPVINDSVIAGGCPSASFCPYGVITTDPNLGTLANNGGFTTTIALGSGSSAINTGGIHSACPVTDQRNTTRPQGAGCDIGAFEVDQAPLVTSVSSTTTDGAYKAGATIAVTVNFNEIVNVTNTPQLTLETGATDRIVNYASGSGTTTLIFNYTVQAGDTSSDLDYVAATSLSLNTTGTIKDVTNNAATLTLASPGATNSLGANKAIVIDTIAPSVTSFTLKTPATSPTNADTLVFLATFGEAVTDVDTLDFVKNSSSTASVTNITQATASTYNVTISGGDLAGFNGTVNLNLSGTPTITDLAGNALPAGEPSTDETYDVANPPKEITTFSFASPATTGVITGTDIAVTVPFGTDVTTLVPTIVHTGASVSPDSGVAQDFTSPVTYTVTATDAQTRDYLVTITIAANTAKAITAFSFASPAATGTVTEVSHTIAVTVPFGTNLNGLVATFTTTGASVEVGGTTQVSGTTANDFTNPVTYRVIAADTTSQDYVITVTIAPSPAKAITAFSFTSPAATGTVTEATHTIAVTVPFGTNPNGLVATFTTTGASVAVGGTMQVSGTTANNFSSPVTYRVTAADTTFQDYIVTVTVAPDSTPPMVISSLRNSASPTSFVSVEFVVSFSESVTGVETAAPFSDFGLTTTGVTGASITGVNGSGLTRTVTVNTGSGNGTIRLNVIDDDTIKDAALNPLGGAGAGNGNFTTGAVYSIDKGGDTTGVFRPSAGPLFLKNTNTSGFADVAINYGTAGDYPVVGDWDGNGTTTIGVYRNGIFYLRNSNTLGFADLVFAFGAPGDQPIAGDWNNDGIDTIGVYRGSTVTFELRNTNFAGAPDSTFALGLPGDVGIAGDWNGDGFDTTGVFRPSNGVIFMKNANTSGFADIAINYGIAGDQPVTGDWNDDGIDTIGVYRNAIFYLRNSNTNGFADLVFGLGIPGDMPIAGNWDGLP